MGRSDFCALGLCGRCRGVDHRSESCTHQCHARPDLPLDWCDDCQKYSARPHFCRPVAV